MEQYRTGGYTLNREYDIRGIMIPRIGDLLYYDKADMQVIIQEYDDNRYYADRYILIGIVTNISNDRKTLSLLSPYFIEVELDFNERISEKNIIKQIKSFVKSYTKSLFEENIEDIKFNVTNTNDLNNIIDIHEDIINGMSYLIKNTTLFSNVELIDILNKRVLIYIDNNKLMFTYGLSDNFSDEFKTLKINKKNVQFNNTKTLKELKELCSDTSIKCYVMPVAKITLD